MKTNIQRLHATFTSNEPSSVPKSQKSVEEHPSNPEIPYEAWSYPNNTILGPIQQQNRRG
ncbi:hypothetical protein HI914_01186 [Erysiphe necator]|nr:hypothetical protein HI914_01186 [Erysiphe necator]